MLNLIWQSSDDIDIFGSSIDILTLILFILIFLALFFGQNFQGWRARGQIVDALIRLRIWRDRGIHLLHKIIDPISPKTLSAQETDEFIRDMLEFFVINPSEPDSQKYPKIRFLLANRQLRINEQIGQILKGIDESKTAQINAILQATIEINQSIKKLEHDYILGKKTRSHLYALQTEVQLTQIMYNAYAYAIALDSFMDNKLIGDSIGPLAVANFIKEVSQTENILPKTWNRTLYGMKVTEIQYENRKCVCVRANGPYSGVGQPGEALNSIMDSLAQFNDAPKLVVLIDASLRLEGESPGQVAQGLGVAVGDGVGNALNKYQIETLCIEHKPPIPIESIICKESLNEAVSPMSESIQLAIPKILRILRKVIRSQSQPESTVVIFGIGNGLGVQD